MAHVTEKGTLPKKVRTLPKKVIDVTEKGSTKDTYTKDTVTKDNNTGDPLPSEGEGESEKHPACPHNEITKTLP